MASIEKRNGKYRVRYRDPSAGNRSRTFRRKADADRFAREVEVDKDRGDWIDPRKSADLARRQWSETFLASSLVAGADDAADLSARPRALRPARPRRPAAVAAQRRGDRAVAQRPSSPAASRRRRCTATTGRCAASCSPPSRRTGCSPTRAPGPPAAGSRPGRWRSSRGRRASPSPKPTRSISKPMIYLALDSGMRWSELVGLRRGQVDLARRKVRVTEQLLRRRRRWLRRPTKTAAGVRSITISASTAEHARAPPRPTGRPTTGRARVHDDRRHTAAALQLPDPHWKKALAAAGVKCRFHDLRHTSVALAIASGAHPKAIQVRMGHSTISVTLDRYGHLFPELDEAIAVAFDQGWTQARAAAGVA